MNTLFNQIHFNFGDALLTIYTDHPKKTHYYSDLKDLNAIMNIHSHIDYEFFLNPGDLSFGTENKAFDFFNNLVVVPPKFKHYYLSKSEPIHFFLSVKKAKKGPPLYDKLVSALNQNLTVIPLDDELSYIYSALCSLNQNLSSNDIFNTDRTHALLVLLLTNVFRNLGIQLSSGQDMTSYGRYGGTIEQFINNNYKGNVKLIELANVLSLSERQTNRVLNLLYGKSFTELITEKKMTVASSLLQNTNMKITQIAELLGYEKPGYFYVVFKKHFNISPKKFRIKIQRGETSNEF